MPLPSGLVKHSINLCMNEYELVVSEGKRPLWRTLVSAFSFTVMFWSLSRLVSTCYGQHEFSTALGHYIAAAVEISSMAFAGGVTFAMQKSIYIDLDKNLLVSKFFVGPITWKHNDIVPKLEYVSVFLTSKEIYEVNLWYNGNQHYTMYCFEDKTPAMVFATDVSKKLKLDLLDATRKNDFQWIELPKK